MKYLATLVVLFISLLASAQIKLLKDINTKVGGGEYSFFPRDLYTFGTTAYFLQRTTASETYLYKTDGTSVQAIPPVSDTHNLKSLNGKLYFSSFRHVMSNANLWQFNPATDTEGSIAVTFPLDAIDTIIVHNNHLYVAGVKNFPAAQQLEIWKTDGTQAGSTKLVTLSGQYNSFKNFTAAGDKLYFTYDGYKDSFAEYGNEIWVSDGTPAGTNVVDFIPGPTGGDYANLRDANGLLYYTFNNGRTLMRSNGTLPGTFDLYSDNSLKPTNLVHTKKGTFFSTFSALWRTDGTNGGTVKIKDMPVSQPEGIRSIIFYRDSIFFIGPNENSGTDLWWSNGTTSGTKRCNLAGVLPNRSLTVANDSLYFFGYGNNGDNLYKSDGKSFGSKMILLGHGNYGGGTGPIHVVGARIYFSYKINGVSDLWVSDGTPASTHVVPKINVSPEGSNPDSYGGATLNDKFIFGANEGTAVSSSTLWITDGTTAGTVPLKNLNPVEPGASPTKFFTFGNHVYFVANTAPYNGGFPRDAVWKTDGTEAGTLSVKNQPVSRFFAINNQVHFLSYNPGNGSTTIWKTDGTSGGTVEVVPELPAFYDNGVIEVVNNIAYFSASGTLWRTDGTPEGTVSISESTSSLVRMTRVGDKLFFITQVSPSYKLWVIKNNSATPELVRDFGTNGIEYLDAAGDKAIVAIPQSLWSSDGTAAGTTAIASGNYLNISVNSIAFHPTDGSSLFMSFNSSSTAEGFELWKTDGTQTGTVLVKDIEFPNYLAAPVFTGFNGSYPHNIFSHKNKVYFFTQWGEFWQTDGTTTNTKRLDPGQGLQIKGIYPVGDRIIFAAKDGRVGTELFVIDLNSTKQDQTITFTTASSHTFGGGNFSLTATATSGLPVTFTSSDPSVLKVTGSVVEILKAGSAQIIAQQTGNDNFNPAPQIAIDVTVDKASQTIAFTTPDTKTLGGPNFTLTATSTSGLPVSFSTSSTKINLAGNVVAIAGAGKANIVASQTGNANYLAAENREVEFCINPLPPTIALVDNKILSTVLLGNTWYKDNVQLAETGQQVPAIPGSTYTATVTVDGCVSVLSSPLTIPPSVVNGLEDPSELIVTPNPASDHVYINWSGADDVNIQLMNSVGQLTGIRASKISQGVFRLKVDQLTPGLYVLRITDAHLTRSARLIIMN